MSDTQSDAGFIVEMLSDGSSDAPFGDNIYLIGNLSILSIGDYKPIGMVTDLQTLFLEF